MWWKDAMFTCYLMTHASHPTMPYVSYFHWVRRYITILKVIVGRQDWKIWVLVSADPGNSGILITCQPICIIRTDQDFNKRLTMVSRRDCYENMPGCFYEWTGLLSLNMAMEVNSLPRQRIAGKRIPVQKIKPKTNKQKKTKNK